MRKLKVWVTLVMVCGMIVGCGKNSADTGSKSAVNQATEQDGIVLNTALTEEFVSPDPNKSDSGISLLVSKRTCLGLYKFTKEGELVLDAAKSVDISEDQLTYTFTMRDDIFWSNGDPVTAKDFEYSFRRLADPDVACTYAYMLATLGITNANAVAYEGAPLEELGIEAVDETTLILHFDAPKSYMTELLANSPCFFAVNQAYAEAAGDQFMKDLDHAIFCGPYYISKWEVGTSNFTLTKNTEYYDADTISVAEMNYQLLPDAQQRILAWENGTLDEAGLKGDFVAMYQDDPAVMVDKLAGMFFITFNTEDENFKNKNLRLAISTAIKKDEIVNNILCDGSIAADYIIPDGFGMDSKGTIYRENAGNPLYNQYDIDAAKEYWEKAKQELGVDTIEVDFLYHEDTQLALVAAYIKAELEAALEGLVINLHVTTYNQRVADMGAGNYQFGITRWYADYQDPSTYLDMWISDSALNYGSWDNKEYNELYSKVVGEYAIDEEKRIPAQAKMEKIFLEDAGVCPLYQTTSVVLRNTDYNWYYAPNNYMLPEYTDCK